MEKINDLVGYKNRRIYQDDDYFCFSVDAVFLANFTTVRKNTKKVLDIGTGTLPIPLILTLRKSDLEIDAVEIQKELAELSTKSVEINKLEKNINVIHQDILKYKEEYDGNTYDLIVCNPPYFRFEEESKLPPSKHKKIARHEVSITLEDCFVISKKLLKNNGVLSMIHRTERFLEVVDLYRKYDISPSRVRFIYSNVKSNPKLFFIEGIKSGKATLNIENPFIIYDTKGKETEEYMKLLEEVL